MRAELFDERMLAELLDQVMTPERMADVMAQAHPTRETWAKDRSERRKTIIAEQRLAEKARANLFSTLEFHGKDAPNLGDITLRLREWSGRIRSLEARLVDLENERMSVNEQPEVDPAEAAAVLRDIVLNCDDPKELSEFVGSFVREITVTVDEVCDVLQSRPKIEGRRLPQLCKMSLSRQRMRKRSQCVCLSRCTCPSRCARRTMGSATNQGARVSRNTF